MAYYIQGILIVIVETACSLIFFDSFSAKRFGSRSVNLLFSFLTYIVLLVSVFALNDHLIPRLAVTMLALGLIMTLSRKLKLWKAMVISLLFFGLVGVIDLIYYIACMLIYDMLNSADSGITLNLGLATVLAKLTDFLAVVAINKRFSKNDPENTLKGTEWIRFTVFPVFTIGVIIAMMNDSKIYGDARLENVYMLLSIGLVIVTIVAFYLMSDIVKNERVIREDELFREKVRSQTENYKIVYENYELQRKRAHEYKNQVMCMEALLRRKEYGELEKYITEIGGKLTDVDSNILTNNPLVDAIVNTKYREMEEKGILLVLKINEMKDLWIGDDDIVVILSNLLNNAIEACEKCEEKTVKLKLMKEGAGLVISVRNTYDGVINKSGDKILTSKNDKEQHGLGIGNITEAVERNGGSYSIGYDDKEFVFSIFIPEKEK